MGTKQPSKSKEFYSSILGLAPSVEQSELTVFNSGIMGVDFNTSTHLNPKTTVVSFLTDDLQIIIDRLSENGIAFIGPKASHLGMLTINFTDPDGNWISVNQPTKDSPTWLQV